MPTEYNKKNVQHRNVLEGPRSNKDWKKYFSHPTKGKKRVEKFDRRSTKLHIKRVKKYAKAVKKGKDTRLLH